MNEKYLIEIKELIIQTVQNKLQHYRPETVKMPFHYRLLGKDRMALFSFIHSLNTTFGISIFEPVGEYAAREKFNARRQYPLGNFISTAAQHEIADIMAGLRAGISEPDWKKETERLRKAAVKGKMQKIRTVKADLFLKEKGKDKYYLIDLKTAKPNVSAFEKYKQTLLEWTAIFLTHQPDADIQAFIAIPYNPYEPQPYKRWTLKGMLDLHHQLKVGEEFWDFLGGEGTYEALLDTFEQAGMELRPVLDDYFKRFE